MLNYENHGAQDMCTSRLSVLAVPDRSGRTQYGTPNVLVLAVTTLEICTRVVQIGRTSAVYAAGSSQRRSGSMPGVGCSHL
jgi:hypothetical protein